MMIDDLDLFDEEDDRGRKRRHAKSSRRGSEGGGRRGRSWFALIMTLVLLGALGAGGYVAYDKIKSAFSTPDYEGDGSGEVTIEIKAGAVGTDIAKLLKANDVIKSEQAFIDASAANPKARNIQPGFYTLHKQMSGANAIVWLLDPKNRIVKGVAIPEGMITIEIFDKLAKELKVPRADFDQAEKAILDAKVIPDWWWKRTDGKEAAKTLEGFLFPATYEFPPNATADSALRLMINKFMAVMQEIDFVDTVQKTRGGISPYEALITASIAEAEFVDQADLPKGTRVIYNRVFTDKFPCKCLGIDSAVNYYLEISGKGAKDSSQLTDKELHDPNNPYNTHDVAGLPPGPIGNPGENALKAAMTPADGKWLYWVGVDSKGTTLFAETWAQHCDNGRVAVRNGILKEPC